MNPRKPETIFCYQQSSTESLEQLLRPSAAAGLLAISPRKLWQLSRLGELPTIRIGRCLRYSREDLREWIATHRRHQP